MAQILRMDALGQAASVGMVHYLGYPAGDDRVIPGVGSDINAERITTRRLPKMLGHYSFYFWSLVALAIVGVVIMWHIERELTWIYAIWAAFNCGVAYLLFMV